MQVLLILDWQIFFFNRSFFFLVLLAGVLFAVFQQAAGQDQMVMMQQWVLSSLPNFTKRSPVSHSMWCLTVFFFSAAADNCHLQVFCFLIIINNNYTKNKCAWCFDCDMILTDRLGGGEALSIIPHFFFLSFPKELKAKLNWDSQLGKHFPYLLKGSFPFPSNLR